MRKEAVPVIVFKNFIWQWAQELLNHGESSASCFEKKTTVAWRTDWEVVKTQVTGWETAGISTWEMMADNQQAGSGEGKVWKIGNWLRDRVDLGMEEDQWVRGDSQSFCRCRWLLVSLSGKREDKWRNSLRGECNGFHLGMSIFCGIYR